MANDTITIFDRKAVRTHHQRAAAYFSDHAVLFRLAAERLVERLGDIRRSFPLAVELGCRHGILAHLLDGSGVSTLIQCNRVADMLHPMRGPRLVTDEELLPFGSASVDMVISALSLHWVNDLPGTLIQIRRMLKPGGAFLATLFGPQTLKELREAMMQAEAAQGGASPRISPFLDVREGGDLLQRAGFILPVADSETLTITYDDALHLMHDLRGMGETNALCARAKHFTSRRTMLAAAEAYQRLFGLKDGSIPATFELVTLTGWAAE